MLRGDCFTLRGVLANSAGADLQRSSPRRVRLTQVNVSDSNAPALLVDEQRLAHATRISCAPGTALESNLAAD